MAWKAIVGWMGDTQRNVALILDFERMYPKIRNHLIDGDVLEINIFKPCK
jgi:hypothetical protein